MCTNAFGLEREYLSPKSILKYPNYGIIFGSVHSPQHKDKVSLNSLIFTPNQVENEILHTILLRKLFISYVS